MKLMRFCCFLMLLSIVTSCEHVPDCQDEVICETVHRYGVPLELDDWSSRGQNGQVVSMRKDGVTVTRSYEGGILHGDCLYTFPHRDVIEKREVYNQETLVEEFNHYPHGIPQQHIVYVSPTHQSSVIWYENGAPRCREEREGERLVKGEYYDFNQQLESHVEDGYGLRTCRNGCGGLESVDKIENGEMSLRTTYHSNGMPATVSPYVKGVIEGKRQTYWSGGEPATIEEWTNHSQHGMTTVFEHGEKRAYVPYVNGTKHGIERRYRGDEDQLVQEITWVKGQKHGPCLSYLGNTSKTDWYFQDRLVANKATFDMLCNQ